MEKLRFSGYDPKPVMEAKLNKILDIIEELQAEVEKIKQSAEPAKKTVKAKPAEE